MPIDADSKSANHSPIAPAPEGDFLLFLGARVREIRNRRGMSRKMVAHESDVSERHLAQLETGEGNISIVLLRRIAAALNVSLVELFAPEAEEPVEKRLIHRFLERLPADRRQEVICRLMREYSDDEKARHSR